MLRAELPSRDDATLREMPLSESLQRLAALVPWRRMTPEFAAARVERAAASRRPTQGRGCRFRVGTCRPMPVEADAGGASTMSHGLVPRAIGNVRQLPMYSGRTPGRTTNGKFRRRLPSCKAPELTMSIPYVGLSAITMRFLTASAYPTV